ncbi:unnamed protein product [Rhizophagus irregularis]|nr:unnamed protein product [Rhizophagus irregularis]
MTEVNKVYGITQNPETNDYMIVLSDKFTLEFMNEVASHNKVDSISFIINKKFSDSLQINFSQLNINKDESLQMDINN